MGVYIGINLITAAVCCIWVLFDFLTHDLAANVSYRK